MVDNFALLILFSFKDDDLKILHYPMATFFKMEENCPNCKTFRLFYAMIMSIVITILMKRWSQNWIWYVIEVI